jgi:ABC-2 type transport system ATP-binding protein
MPDATAAVLTHDLRRSYISTKGVIKVERREHEALRGINLRVEVGEVFGLLGPNGAGKTTLTKVLSTVLLPTSGSASVLGADVVTDAHQVRQRIGLVLGGERGLYYRLTARQTLEYWAALYRIDARAARGRIGELLELVGLTAQADERVEGFSRGMKQRLHLARGLIHEPEVIFLDEPTVGLDPVASIAVRGIVLDLKAKGVTVFLTTHYMAEAEALCDRVAFINEGQIALLDKPSALTSVMADFEVVQADFALGQESCLTRLKALRGVQDVEVITTAEVQRFVIRAEGTHILPQLLRDLSTLGVIRVNSKEPTLEDVYLRLHGERGMRV